MSAKKRKGYISVEVEQSVRVDISSIMDDILDEDLLDECISRDLSLPRINKKNIQLEGDNLFRHLCDIAETNYYASFDELMDIISHKVNYHHSRATVYGS